MMLMVVCITAISITYGKEGEEAEAAPKGMTFLGLIKAGGWIMVPILLGSVAMVALTIEHALTLQFKKVIPEDFKNTKIQIRTIDAVPFSLKITENIAGLAFYKEKTIDFDEVLTSEHEDFRYWTSLLFNYFWDKARPHKF